MLPAPSAKVLTHSRATTYHLGGRVIAKTTAIAALVLATVVWTAVPVRLRQVLPAQTMGRGKTLPVVFDDRYQTRKLRPYPSSSFYSKARLGLTSAWDIADSARFNDRLCLQVCMHLNMTDFTLTFAKGALEWMVNSAFTSLENQTMARIAWPDSWQAILVIADDTANNTILDEHQRLVNMILTEPIRKLQREGVHLHMTTNATICTSLLEHLVKDNPQCSWVTKIRLDADDILAPGYFEYIANDVIANKLEGTTTARGDSWLGALVASRTLNKLVLGKGICEAKLMETNIFAGLSVGQSVLLSASAFVSLGYKMVSGNHGKLGQILRNEVARKVLHDAEYSSRAGAARALNKETKQMEDGFSHYNEKYDLIDATRSRVMILDSKETFGKIHPYLVTPLSGHFPWDKLSNIPRCNTSQMEKIKIDFGYNVDFAFAGMKAVEPIELIDACRSHNNFRGTATRLFESEEEDCFHMVQRRANSYNVTL